VLWVLAILCYIILAGVCKQSSTFNVIYILLLLYCHYTLLNRHPVKNDTFQYVEKCMTYSRYIGL